MNYLFYNTSILLFGYSTIATLIYYFIEKPSQVFNSYELLWPLTLFTYLVGIVLFEKNEIRKSFSIGFLKLNLDTFFVFILLLGIRFINIHNISVWLDEYNQASMTFFNYPITAGLKQHQPPLDMIFTKIGLLFSDSNVWGLRFHSAFFSAMAGTLFYALIKKISDSYIMALVCVFYFSFHVFVIRFGYEARPVSLGLFIEILFIHHIYSILTEGNNAFYKNKPCSLSALTFVYLCSLGMQPVFIVCATLLFFAIYSYFHRDQLKNFFALLIGFLCFLPIQAKIMLLAPPLFSKTSVFDFQDIFKQLTFENFFILEPFFKPFGYCAFLFLVFIFGYNILKRQSFSRPLLYFLFCVTFFCGVLIPVFKSHINWDLNDYYLLSSLPLVLSLFVLSLSDIARIASVKKKFFNLLTLFFAAVCFAFYSFGPFFNFEKTYPRDDMRASYAEIKRVSGSENKSLVLALCLKNLPWCPDKAIGEALYFKSANASKESYWQRSLDNYYIALKTDKPIENVFFIYYESFSRRALNIGNKLASPPGIELYKIPIANNVTLASAVIDFLVPVVQQGLDENAFYTRSLEYLIMSYDHLNDKKNKLHYLGLYKKFRDHENYSTYLDNVYVSLVIEDSQGR